MTSWNPLQILNNAGKSLKMMVNYENYKKRSCCKCGLCTMRGTPFSKTSGGDVNISWWQTHMCNNSFENASKSVKLFEIWSCKNASNLSKCFQTVKLLLEGRRHDDSTTYSQTQLLSLRLTSWQIPELIFLQSMAALLFQPGLVIHPSILLFENGNNNAAMQFRKLLKQLTN